MLTWSYMESYYVEWKNKLCLSFLFKNIKTYSSKRKQVSVLFLLFNVRFVLHGQFSNLDTILMLFAQIQIREVNILIIYVWKNTFKIWIRYNIYIFFTWNNCKMCVHCKLSELPKSWSSYLFTHIYFFSKVKKITACY